MIHATISLLSLLMFLGGCKYSDNNGEELTRYTLLQDLRWGELHSIPFDSLIASDPYIFADNA